MAPQLTEIANLLKLDIVKQAAPNPAGVEQYLKNAEALLKDCGLVTAAVSRFMMAYEGTHAVAMAVLLHFEARPGDAQGHRSQALQIVANELKLNTARAGSEKTLMDLHRQRNDKIYREPMPPLTEANAKAAVELLDLMINQARKVIASNP